MERYARQTSLPEIGIEGQQRLKAARVLIVGVGGLGSPIALYLTAAGIGHIGLADGDTVSVNNLQRQVLYREEDVGKLKSQIAANNLRKLNSEVEISTFPFLNADNAEEIISLYDVIIDGCDNFKTRYLVNNICKKQKKPYIYGAIQGFEGQVSVFGAGKHPCWYTDIYPEGSLSEVEISKSVIGTTPAIVGSVEASEAIKLIAGYGDLLSGKLWTIDLRTMQSYTLNL